MNRRSYLQLLFCTVVAIVSWAPASRADNGTVVSGTVIAIDAVNQVMRVYVTAVDGQPLFGGPETNYVDYLVAPETVVLGASNQLVSQSNVLVGSRIQMQFVGAYASRILLLGNYNYGVEVDYGAVNYGSPNSNYSSTYVQSYTPARSYATVVSVRKPIARSVTNTFHPNTFRPNTFHPNTFRPNTFHPNTFHPNTFRSLNPQHQQVGHSPATPGNVGPYKRSPNPNHASVAQRSSTDPDQCPDPKSPWRKR